MAEHDCIGGNSDRLFNWLNRYVDILRWGVELDFISQCPELLGEQEAEFQEGPLGTLNPYVMRCCPDGYGRFSWYSLTANIRR